MQNCRYPPGFAPGLMWLQGAAAHSHGDRMGEHAGNVTFNI